MLFEQKKATILIVDDQAENIDMLVAILSSDYAIKVSISSKKAIEIAKSENPPDLILLDIMMPEINGYEICKVLKEDKNTKEIPIIFVTSKGAINEESKGFELGAVDYIIKPITAPTVLARVDTHIRMYNQHQICEEKVKKRTKELLESQMDLIKSLSLAAEYKDNETGMHVLRISELAYTLAKEIGLGEVESELIKNASPMHDVGKIGISDAILLKPGRLDENERNEMKKHPEIGARIIGESKLELLKLARISALTHHEKWDGTGYPEGLKAEEIPLIGRIVALVDVFDALISERPYKKPWPIDKILDLIKSERGKHFDPRLVDAFFKSLDRILEINGNYVD